MDLAVNGKDGVEIFTHAMPHTYDAILMDIRMPLMDGIEATQIIRQSTHPESDIIPIIAMTADAFDEDRQRTRDAGMNAHITKPINPQELFTTLTNYLR
jgi:CheY-like chemotaxis protein